MNSNLVLILFLLLSNMVLLYLYKIIDIMKKILIPTDFSENSLKLLDYVEKVYPDELCSIVLLFGYRLSHSETELLSYSNRRVIQECTDRKFHDAKADYLRKLSHHINSIDIKIFTGVTPFAFQNFRDAHQIHNAIVPSKGFLDYREQPGFDPSKFIKRDINTVYKVTLLNHDISEQKQKKSFLQTIWKF